MPTWRASTSTALTPNPEEALKPSQASGVISVLDSLFLQPDFMLLFLMPYLDCFQVNLSSLPASFLFSLFLR